MGVRPPQYVGGAPLARTKVGARRGGFHILDGAGETLVLLGIVVLQTDLEVHSLQELPLLVLIQKKVGVKGSGLYWHYFIDCRRQGEDPH